MSNPKVRAGSDAMGTEKIPTLILRFAIPAILTMLVNALYNFTDKIFVGQAFKATILSMSRQIFGLIPFMLILPRIFGLNGVVMSFPLADFIVCSVVVGMMIFEWKKLKTLEERLPETSN